MLNNINKNILENSGRPRIRVNREYLLSKPVAADLNSYLGFETFRTYADVFSEDELVAMAKDSKYEPKVGYPGVKSIFNPYGAMLLGKGKDDKDVLNASQWRLSNNVPLIDTPDNRKSIRSNSGYTIRELVDASQKGVLGKATYSYADFMYCKYLGLMPNNYLITLRRFPQPVDDYISSTGLGEMRKSDKIYSSFPNGMGTLITWLNTPGNGIEEILTYSMSMPFEEKTAELNQDVDADANSKPLNQIASLFDKTYRQQYQAGMAGQALNDGYIGKLFGKIGMDSQSIAPPYHDWLSFRDGNKVYGPIYAVKKTYYPSDRGLDFEQSIKLTFEYELRSYNGINGRQAMLDLISNILAVTYTTGTFWGGGWRSGGAHQNNIFTNLEIFKAKGGLPNFMEAFFKDISTLQGGAKKSIQENGGLIPTIKNFLNDLGGMLTGALLNKLGRPQKATINSLLSEAPTGFWHLTIGNPFHPIVSIGNLILKNTTITHTGPLGLDDFPTGLKVECTLERGKPRDMRGIELMYMNGNDRIYSTMGPKIFDMYTHAREYKAANNAEKPKDEAEKAAIVQEAKLAASQLKQEYVDMPAEYVEKSLSHLGDTKKTLMKYFGIPDEESVSTPAKELGFGAFKIKTPQKTKSK